MRKTALHSVLVLGLVGAMTAVSALADTTLYSNDSAKDDSIEGINFSAFAVTDSFTLSQSSTVTSVTFDAWLYPGDTMASVDWSIGNSAFGSSLGAGTAATIGVFKTISPHGNYSIYTVTISGLDLSLASGTYWLTFQNAQAANGDTVFWDENDGPSTAYYQVYGDAITSETFQILGTETPEPSSFLLLGSGLAGLAGLIKRKLAA
jgi:hypothetical protein